METLKMHSLDGVQRNIDLIGKLFPNAITEVKRNGKVEHAIDFDVLRQELSDSIVEGREERYQSGSAEALAGNLSGQGQDDLH